jgi:hypothetical protein
MNPFDRIIFLVLFSLLAFQLAAQTPKYSNEFLIMGVSARAPEMGNAVVANVSDFTLKV